MACVALCIAAAWIDCRTRQSDAAFYSSALREAGVDKDMRVGDASYRITGGRIESVEGAAALPLLRLAYAKTLAERAPLMALAGNDPSDIRRLVASLRILQEDIAEAQDTVRERELTLWALYPIGFLFAMADAEEARVRFIDDSTEAHLAEYLEARRAALLAYRQDSRRYALAFEALVPPTPGRFLLGETLVSYADMRATLSQVRRAAALAQERDRAQRLCLAGSTAQCDPIELQLLPPERVSKAAVSAQEFARAGEIVRILRKDPTETEEEWQRGGITVAPSLSRCGATPPVYRVKDTYSTTDGAPYRKVTYVGDIRFIQSESLSEVPFYKYFASRGVTYIPTSPLLHYVCQEFGFDLSRVLAIESVGAFSERAHLSQFAVREEAASLRALEDSLKREGTDKLVHEATAREYLTRAVSLGRTGALSQSLEREIEELLLSLSNKSAGWTDSLQLLIDTDGANVRILKKGVPVDLEAAYVFFFRSPLLFLFMAQNPSVSSGVRIEGRPADSISRNPYTYYSELPHTPAMIERLTRDAMIYREVHLQAPEEPIERLFEL